MHIIIIIIIRIIRIIFFSSIIVKTRIGHILRHKSLLREEEPSICIARRREYTSNALSSLKLSRQVTAHSLHTQVPCSDPTTGHRKRQP